jgi:transcriptional regulator with XRE-family HTH domain
MSGADLILMARRRAGLTQRELAERIDCRQATIARWERGSRQPSYEDVQAVARACDLQIEAHLAPADLSWWPQIAVQLDRTPVQRVRQLTQPGAFDVLPILKGLANNRTPAIVIGEIAGALHGSPLVLTGDIVEVCAMGESCVEAREGLFVTEVPSGTAGFADLARDADTVAIDGRALRVAALRDLLRIADASPHPDSRRQALAYGAVLDVQLARLKASVADDRSDEEKIQAWLSEQSQAA